MEELRSTEILDKEIEADARRKAERILANADVEAKKLLDDVAVKVSETEKQKAAFYSDKVSRYENNLEAALPLEKGRFLVSFYSDSVEKAINKYLLSLSEEKRIEILSLRLKNKQSVFDGKKVIAYCYGLTSSLVKKILEKSFSSNLLSVEEISFEKSREEPGMVCENHEGIIIESEDKVVRYRLTIDQIVRELKDKYSYELSTTLFGGRLPK